MDRCIRVHHVKALSKPLQAALMPAGVFLSGIGMYCVLFVH